MPRGLKSMSRLTSSYCVCCQKELITCHNRCLVIVKAFLGWWWHSTPNVIRPCGIEWAMMALKWLTLYDRVFLPRAMMACQDWCSSTVYVVNGRYWHATPNIVHHVCCPRAKMACHVRHRLMMRASQWKWWYAMSDVIRPSDLTKGHATMPRLTSSDLVWCPRPMI